MARRDDNNDDDEYNLLDYDYDDDDDMTNNDEMITLSENLLAANPPSSGSSSPPPPPPSRRTIPPADPAVFAACKADVDAVSGLPAAPTFAENLKNSDNRFFYHSHGDDEDLASVGAAAPSVTAGSRFHGQGPPPPQPSPPKPDRHDKVRIALSNFPSVLNENKLTEKLFSQSFISPKRPATARSAPPSPSVASSDTRRDTKVK